MTLPLLLLCLLSLSLLLTTMSSHWLSFVLFIFVHLFVCKIQFQYQRRQQHFRIPMIITNLHKLIVRILVGVQTQPHTHTGVHTKIVCFNWKIFLFSLRLAYLYDLLINHCCGIRAAIKAAQKRRAAIIKYTPYAPDIGTHTQTHTRRYRHASKYTPVSLCVSIVAQLSDSCAFNGNFPRINSPQREAAATRKRYDHSDINKYTWQFGLILNLYLFSWKPLNSNDCWEWLECMYIYAYWINSVYL